jgi:hypothetical protein
MNPDKSAHRAGMKMWSINQPFHELFLLLVVLNRKARKAICSTRSLFYALIKFLLEELIQSVHTSPGTIPANDATCAARRLRAAPR